MGRLFVGERRLSVPFAAGLFAISGTILLSLVLSLELPPEPNALLRFLSVPGRFLFECFLHAAFFVPAYLAAAGALLLLRNLRFRLLLLLNALVVPFFTAALLFRLLGNPDSAAAPRFVLTAFGRTGGAVLLALLLLLEVLTIVRLLQEPGEGTEEADDRPDSEPASRFAGFGTAGQASSAADGRKVISARIVPGPAGPVEADPENGIRRLSLLEYLRRKRDEVAARATGAAAADGEADTDADEYGLPRVSAFRVPDVPEVPELRSRGSGMRVPARSERPALPGPEESRDFDDDDDESEAVLSEDDWESEVEDPDDSDEDDFPGVFGEDEEDDAIEEIEEARRPRRPRRPRRIPTTGFRNRPPGRHPRADRTGATAGNPEGPRSENRQPSGVKPRGAVPESLPGPGSAGRIRCRSKVS